MITLNKKNRYFISYSIDRGSKNLDNGYKLEFRNLIRESEEELDLGDNLIEFQESLRMNLKCSNVHIISFNKLY
jgi:hypothetical protein